MHLTHFNAFGTRHYDRLFKTLTNPRGARLQKDKVYFLPNVTNLTSNIETRGQSLTKNL